LNDVDIGAERVATIVESRAARKVPNQILPITSNVLPVLGSSARYTLFSWGDRSPLAKPAVSSASLLAAVRLPLLNRGLVSEGLCSRDESVGAMAITCEGIQGGQNAFKSVRTLLPFRPFITGPTAPIQYLQTTSVCDMICIGCSDY